MKRTPLQRKKPLRAKKPLDGGKGLERKAPLARENKARKATRKAVTDGPQSALCREALCCACGLVPSKDWPTEPHHWPTVARGGTDRDTMPLCRGCHRAFHDLGERRWRLLTGVDYRQVQAHYRELVARAAAQGGAS